MDYSKRLQELIALETRRQNDGLELIASENYASKKVRAIQGSILTNKYAEGLPGARYYGGCEFVDQIEQMAIDLVTQLYGCKYANVQPHSGSSANAITYAALLNPGDTILSLALDEGGHLTHGSKVNFSGKNYRFVHYKLGDNMRIDYEGLRQLALVEKPKLIVAGFSAYPFITDFARIGQIAKEVNSLFMVDMAHISGLIAAGVHPSPFPHADVVTSTTHKTIRGPRGGMILTNSEELIKKLNSATFPGSQGGPLEHIIGAKAQCFYEAMQPGFKKYAAQIVKNTKACNDEFAHLGAVVSGTETHLFLIDAKKSFGLTGAECSKRLDTVLITLNKNMLPKDTEKPQVTSGIRIGLAALTTRGADEEMSREVARIIYGFLTNKVSSDETLKKVKKITKKLKNISEI